MDTEYKPVYLCDYRKNHKCPKTICAWNMVNLADCDCYMTTDKEFALLDHNGQPIVLKYGSEYDEEVTIKS